MLAETQPPRETGQRADFVEQRCCRLARIYRDFAYANRSLLGIRSISQEDASALLAYWISVGRSPSTIRCDWSVLRAWCTQLGLPELIGPLRQAWKDAPPAPSRKNIRPRSVEPWLLDSLQTQDDQTHYFIERLGQLARLTTQEALRFPARPDEHPPDSTTAEKLHAAMKRDPHAIAQLLLEVRNFLDAQNRRQLNWSGISLPKALRRHDNKLAYQRRKLGPTICARGG